jgi:hypothetical protein
VPQLLQGLLQPAAAQGTEKPQRMQVGGEAGKRGSGDVEEAVISSWPWSYAESERSPASPLLRFPALAKPVRSGEERVGHSFDAYGRVGTMSAVHHRAVCQRKKLGLKSGH